MPNRFAQTAERDALLTQIENFVRNGGRVILLWRTDQESIMVQMVLLQSVSETPTATYQAYGSTVHRALINLCREMEVGPTQPQITMDQFRETVKRLLAEHGYAEECERVGDAGWETLYTRVGADPQLIVTMWLLWLDVTHR